MFEDFGRRDHILFLNLLQDSSQEPGLSLVICFDEGFSAVCKDYVGRAFMGGVICELDVTGASKPVDDDLDVLAGSASGTGNLRDVLSTASTKDPQDALNAARQALGTVQAVPQTNG